MSWKHVALTAFRITTVFISNAECGIDLRKETCKHILDYLQCHFHLSTLQKEIPLTVQPIFLSHKPINFNSFNRLEIHSVSFIKMGSFLFALK
jgi:hypothetical protein